MSPVIDILVVGEENCYHKVTVSSFFSIRARDPIRYYDYDNYKAHKHM